MKNLSQKVLAAISKIEDEYYVLELIARKIEASLRNEFGMFFDPDFWAYDGQTHELIEEIGREECYSMLKYCECAEGLVLYHGMIFKDKELPNELIEILKSSWSVLKYDFYMKMLQFGYEKFYWEKCFKQFIVQNMKLEELLKFFIEPISVNLHPECCDRQELDCYFEVYKDELEYIIDHILENYCKEQVREIIGARGGMFGRYKFIHRLLKG